MKRIAVSVTASHRRELETIVSHRSAPAGIVTRARIVLLTADGLSGGEIAKRLDVTQEHVSRTRARYREHGVAGLSDRPKAGRKEHAITAEQERDVLELVLSLRQRVVLVGRPGCWPMPWGCPTGQSAESCARTRSSPTSRR